MRFVVVTTWQLALTIGALQLTQLAVGQERIDYHAVRGRRMATSEVLARPETAPTRSTPTPLSLDASRQLTREFCIGCHGEDPDALSGNVNLRQLQTLSDFTTDIQLTQRIWEAVAQGTMPPEGEPQPSAELRRRFATTLDGIIDSHLKATSALQPVVMRRLNRYEYSNAVRDLLHLKGDVYPLPEKAIRANQRYFTPKTGRYPDEVTVGNRTLGKNQVEKQMLKGASPYAIDLQAEHGFNNRGSELNVSPLLLESFLKLGLSIVQSPEFDNYCGISDSLFRLPEESSDEAQRQQTRSRLRSLLRRAFRTPIEDSTLDRYASFLAAEQSKGSSYAAAMKKVVAGVLASPRFLYLSEAKRGERASEPATSLELANRLSFFLWSSIPDDELLQVAERGGLLDRDNYVAQVQRLLEDPRSQALSQNFARQWLRLDQLITAVPDFDRFPQYYSRIGCEQWKLGLQTMIEPLLLFESIVVEDRSIMLLVDCNYSYRSDELQSWYMDATPFQGRKNRNRFNTNQQVYRKRKLDTRRQGGVITSAAVLTMTSSPLRTSPITRGAWVATVIFNQPPPPPPDVIPEIEADDEAIEAQGITLRQRLEQHQSNETCSACHAKIDPLGFALENFDAVGRWRDAYRTGLPIDASGQLFGRHRFKDVVEFKDAILAEPKWFIRAFCEHLLSYALGRKLDITDRPAIDRITTKVMADHGRFSTVVTEIATSYPFLHKTNQQHVEAKP